MVSLNLTSEASAEIKRFLQSEGLPSSSQLRITVQGGACCEPHFDISIESGSPQKHDQQLEIGDLRFLVDDVTAKHLGDSEMDFVSDDFGDRFVFHQNSF